MNLNKLSITQKATALVIIILLADQISKIYVKLHFQLGEQVDVFSWFKITFVENNGMAFGMELIGKLFLTLLRIVAVVYLTLYIRKLIKKQYPQGYILTISLLMAGAAGNILDSLYFGAIFTDSVGKVASITSLGSGYAPPFYGKVVDMFYFPFVKDATGETVFFRYIFNVADSAVSVAVALVALFYRKELDRSFNKEEEMVETPEEKHNQ